MPPEDRFVPRFAAEPPQDLLPYGRWAQRLQEEFLEACLRIDADGEDLGEPGEIVWYPDRTWHGRTFVPATAPTSTGHELYGFVSYAPGTDGEEPTEFFSVADFTPETAEANPDWTIDLCDEVVGTWRGEQGKAAEMTLIWGRPMVEGAAVATAELADLAVDQCVLVVVVKRLGGELLAAAPEQLHVERVAAVVVGGDEREASLDEDALVDGEVGELGRRHGPAVHHRPAPHERHRGGLALLAAPRADDLVAEVDGPVGVRLGRVGGEVGHRVEVRRLLAVAAGRVADVAVELEAVRGAGDAGHERPPVPGAVGEPEDLADLAQHLTLVLDAQAGGEELLLERLRPAAVGQQVLRGLGGEAGDEAVFHGHGCEPYAEGASSMSVTGPSLTSSTSMSAPNVPRAAPRRSANRSYSGSACSGRAAAV